MTFLDRLVDVFIERIDTSGTLGLLDELAFRLDDLSRPDLATRLRATIWPMLGEWLPYHELDIAFRRRDLARLRLLVATPVPAYECLLAQSLAVLGDHEAVLAALGPSPRPPDVRRVVDTYADLGDLGHAEKLTSLVQGSSWGPDSEREWRADFRCRALQRAGDVRAAQKVVTEEIDLIIKRKFAPNLRVTRLLTRSLELEMTAEAVRLAERFSSRPGYDAGDEEIQAVQVLRAHGAPAIAKAAFARWLAYRKDSIDNAFHLHQAYSMTVRGLARLKELRRARTLLPQLKAALEAKEDRGLFVDELVTWARLADPVMSLTRACEVVRGPYLDRVEFELSAFILHCIQHPPRETRALTAALERFRTVNR